MMNHNIQYFRGKINLENFESVTSPVDKRTAMALNISTSGHLAMNDKYRDVMKNMCVDFKVGRM